MASAQFFLSGTQLSNGHTLSFAKGDIVLLVGPNNAGKSTFLKDIKAYIADSSRPRKMLSAVTIETDVSAVKARLKKFFNIQEMSRTWFVVNPEGHFDATVDVVDMDPKRFKLAKAAGAFAITLDAEKRLSLSSPVETIDISAVRPSHPYHHFMLERGLLRRFASVITDAFGLDFTIVRIGNPLRGYVGDKFRNDEDSLEGDKAIPSLGEPVEGQGDGIRSYTGIAAEIVGSSYPVTLLDEPEAFLHPPQAKKLGRLLLDALPMDRQAFVATHSSDFLQGVLSSRSKRVKVVRLSRGQGSLQSSALSNEQLAAAISHPSIANSNLLDSLFFSQTVICEGDADCGLFDWAVRELGTKDHRAIDRFWFATGGKHQTPKVAELLTAFGVDFRVILDLDAITNWDLLARLCKLKGLEISPYKRRLETALSVLAKPDVGAITAEIRKRVEETVAGDEVTQQQLLREIQKSIDKARRSHPLKQYGISAFRNGQERQDVQTFLSTLQAAGITLLSKGEIESYVPEVGLHGPGWAATVLDNFEVHKQNLEHLLQDISPGLS